MATPLNPEQQEANRLRIRGAQDAAARMTPQMGGMSGVRMPPPGGPSPAGWSANSARPTPMPAGYNNAMPPNGPSLRAGGPVPAGWGAAPPPVASAAPTAPVAPAAPFGRATAAGQAVRSLPGVQTALGVGGAAMKGARLAAGPAAVAGVVENFNDYKIDDPEVDSSAKGTFDALRSGDFDMAGRSLSKGALETMMDLGSGVANTLDYVVPGKAPVSTAYNQKLREQFGSLLVDNTPKPDAGAGRGYVNPSMPTTSTAATRPTSPASATTGPNYLNEGRNYPARSAPDLTGKIVRSGNTYTGSNVKAGADIVDPSGRLLNTDDPNNPLSLRRTGVSVAGPGGGGRSPSEIYANTSRINGQISETARALDAYGPGGGGGGPAAGINGNGLFDSLRATQNAGRPMTRTERMAQAELASREQLAAAQTAATLRGQEMSASTSRANTRDTVGATLRGQDMDYAEKLDSKRLDLAARQAERAAVAAAWQGTSDPRVAAQRLVASGRSPADALALATSQQAAAESSDKNFRNITEAAGATVDKNGQPMLNPALQAVAQNVIANAMPGVRNASAADQNARLRDVQSVGNLAVGLQQAQGGSLLQSIGVDNAPPAVSALPNMQGASLRERTLSDSVTSPFSNASRGDYVLVQPDGAEVPIKRSKVGERELDYLKQQGVTLRN